ncbi:MAG: efflux RND transporter permease subunit, partial [Fimbriimonadaceae bacterium]|nr:efflux RND transporter permease subunit [Alphaproteobacteria bacterium]
LYLAFSSSRHSAMEITDFAERYVTDQLQTIDGVAQVRIFGQRRFSMRIWLDPDRLAAFALTPQDVEAALRRQNVEIPAGRIESQDREFSILSETDLKTEEDFNDLIIQRTDAGYLVRLRDIGYAELGPRDERRVVRFVGRSAVALGIVKQATANPLDVSTAVRARIPAITESLPDGMEVRVAYDKSVFIERSIENVYQTIGEAVALVVLIIFFFLRSVRATLIPLVTIPVSLIGSFALMYLFGFSINTLTLLAMVLAIGLVVDDAIVMLENIYRHVEDGMAPFDAAIKGSREIGFAVVAMTLTLAAVYFPIGFMGGTTGRLFTEFALALAGAVIVSGFVALTLSPMMCSRLLKHSTKHNIAYRVIEVLLQGVTRGYRALLSAALRARPLVLLLGLGVAGSSVYLFQQLKSELAPFEDQGVIVGFFIAPEGSTIDYTDRYARELEKIFASVPETERYFSVTGFPVVTQGISFLGLKPWEERERSAQQIAQSMRGRMYSVPGVLAFPVTPGPFGQRASAKPVEFVIETTLPYSELQTMVEAMLDRLREFPGLVNLDTDLKLNTPQLKINVQRDKLADVGVSMEELGRTVETLMGGRQVTRFKLQGEQYDVVVQVADIERTNPDDLRRIYVRGRGGEMVQLSNLIEVTETVAPRELNHFDKLRSATISANLGPGVPLGEALAVINQAAEDVLPLTAQTDYAGQSREFVQSSADIYVTFLLALAFIYLVLSAQFESFRNPLLIMLTVPLSVTGGLLALWLDGSTLNIYSQVGIVTLIGLITKHGILLVEFATQKLAEGIPPREAALQAALLRLRPILMTTGAMVLGAVPLAIATGAGAESRQDIGLVIVGGLLVGTFFTLFVIPVVLSYLSPVLQIKGDQIKRDKSS